MLRYRSIYALYLIAFIDLFAVSLFLPLLSKEIRDLGGDPFLIGVIGSVYGAVQLFSSPIVGWGSDKHGSKIILFICILSTAVGYALQGYASNLGMLLIARSIAGCFKHTQTIGKSIITELAPQEKSHVLANFNAFGSMGFICGPTIGAHLVELEGGFRSVCLLASTAFLVNILILVLLVTTKRKIKAWPSKGKDYNEDLMGGKNAYCGLGTIFSWPQSSADTSTLKYSVTGILFLRFVFSSSTIIPRANLPLTLESKFGTGVVYVGYLNSMQAVVSTITGLTVGPVVSRLYQNDAERMVKHAGFVKAISLLALVVAPTFRLAGLSLLLQSGADPFLRVGITSMSLDGHDDPGTILGLGQSATSLSRMLAPFLAGVAQTYLSDEDGPAIIGFSAALLGLIWSYFVGMRRGFWLWGTRKVHSDTNNGSMSINGGDHQPLINDIKKGVTSHNHHQL